MKERIIIDTESGPVLFVLNRLISPAGFDTFLCPIEEYNLYLKQDALRSQHDLIALTYLLQERRTGSLAVYMSLIADAVRLSITEKEFHQLNYPFRTIPAMKIAKLAAGIAEDSNETHFACRFITVDADIEHDSGILNFYMKNGFLPNSETNNKRSKTINMRKDILLQ